MPELIRVAFDDGSTLYVEGTESARLPGPGGIAEAGVGDRAERALDTAQQLVKSVTALCTNAVRSFDHLDDRRRPTKASVEFGLNFSLEGNIYVVKTGAEATITITAEWEFPKT